MADSDRTASLMTPSKLAQIKPTSAASPAAWLNQMAADAGHVHVRRLRELRDELQAQALARDISPLVSELTGVAEALTRMDFGLVQRRGWWARTTGKSRIGGLEFAAQFNQVDPVARGLAANTQALQKKQQQQATAAELAILELEVECRAIEKIIEEGTRWLHDMRGQLKTRRAAPADPAGQQQLKDDAARCEILVARLKALRGASSAAQQTRQHAQGAFARRAALLQLLRQAVASNIQTWQERLSVLAAAAADDSSRVPGADSAMEAHRDLQLCVKQSLADCGQLQGQERSLSESLQAFGVQLEAV